MMPKPFDAEQWYCPTDRGRARIAAAGVEVCQYIDDVTSLLEQQPERLPAVQEALRFYFSHPLEA